MKFVFSDTDYSFEEILSELSHADVNGRARKKSTTSVDARLPSDATYHPSLKRTSNKNGMPQSRSATEYLASSTPVITRSNQSMSNLPTHSVSNLPTHSMSNLPEHGFLVKPNHGFSVNPTKMHPARHDESMHHSPPQRTRPIPRQGGTSRSVHGGSHPLVWSASNLVRGRGGQSFNYDQVQHRPKPRAPSGSSVGAPYCNEAYHQQASRANAIKITHSNDPSSAYREPARRAQAATRTLPVHSNDAPDGIRRLVPGSRRYDAPGNATAARGNIPPAAPGYLWDDGSFTSLPADLNCMTPSVSVMDFTAAMKAASVVVSEKQLAGGRVRVKRDDSNVSTAPMTTYQYITNNSTLQESSV